MKITGTVAVVVIVILLWLVYTGRGPEALHVLEGIVAGVSNAAAWLSSQIPPPPAGR